MRGDRTQYYNFLFLFFLYVLFVLEDAQGVEDHGRDDLMQVLDDAFLEFGPDFGPGDEQVAVAVEFEDFVDVAELIEGLGQVVGETNGQPFGPKASVPDHVDSGRSLQPHLLGVEVEEIVILVARRPDPGDVPGRAGVDRFFLGFPEQSHDHVPNDDWFIGAANPALI